MWAAAEGKSNLGIPKSVGEEFVRADADQTPPDGGELNDREVAEMVRDGELSSPTKFGDYWLFDLRITGTGAAWRDSRGEYAIRDPQTWLTDEFVERCNGLPVTFGHTDAPGLNSDEWRERAVGTVFLPYRKDDEVRGVAKIYDADAALLMQTTHVSTSPGVRTPEGATPILLESGAQVLDEPLPTNLDHLAICKVGVWDKGGPPEGVRLDESLAGKGDVMADEDREKLEKERDDAKARADAAEKERDDAKARADAAEKERDDARKDAEESKSAAEKEREDARGKRHDAAKHDGEVKDCERCDSEEKEELEKKDRKDGGVQTPDANRGMDDIKDSHDKLVATHASMQAQIDELARANAPLTIDERNELAKAFHRYDSLYQMLLDATPQPLPGEKPIAFRKRCANGLRKYTTNFPNYVFHDAQQSTDFDLVELAIVKEASEYAKNPPADQIVGQVREIKDTTTLPGKTITRFVGDQHAIWAPFKPPMQSFLQRVKPQPARNAAF